MPGDSNDLLVRLAWWAGAASFIMTVMMLAGVLAARFFFLARERREKRFLGIWRPLFVRAVVEQPEGPPKLRGAERLQFLNLFNHFQSLVKGGERGRINRLARMAWVRPYALAVLEGETMRNRIIAAYALGYLRLSDAFEPLVKGLDSENTIFSLACALALVRIDPVRGVRAVLPLVRVRGDWPQSSVHIVLMEAGKDAVSPALREAVLSSDEETVPKLIRFLGAADDATAEECEKHWVDAGKKEETISACLQFLKSPRYLPWARQMLDHPAWFVRVQAIAALGRIGGREDVPRLKDLLSNKEWWIRYRAAKALSGFPFISEAEYAQMATNQQDRYAREMLERVLIETRAERWK